MYKVVVPDGRDDGKEFFHMHVWRPADAHTEDLYKLKDWIEKNIGAVQAAGLEIGDTIKIRAIY